MRQSRRPSKAYARMFTAFAAGAGLVVTGAIGLDVSYMRGMFQGTRWVDGPVWWQLTLGSALLALGAYWARRLSAPAWTLNRAPRGPGMKAVGAGKSAGAGRRDKPRSLPGGPPKT